MFEPKNILVPTDYSVDSDKAIRMALELARQYKAKISLLHVVKPFAPCAADYCADESAIRNAENDVIVQAKDKVHAELAKFYDFKDIEVSTDILEGNTGDEILQDQVDKGIDLIVMSSHGKKGFIKHLIGTVSEKVLEEAKCPVLLVRS
jgi:universal stress protein A